MWGNSAVKMPKRQEQLKSIQYLNFGNLSNKIPDMEAPKTMKQVQTRLDKTKQELLYRIPCLKQIQWIWKLE